MRILVFCAKQNVASKNLFNYFQNYVNLEIIMQKDRGDLYRSDKFDLINYDSDMVRWDDLKDNFDLDYDIILVASSHRAASGAKSFTLHFTGNFSKAMAGGNEQELNLAPAYISSLGIKLLEKNSIPGFEVSLETTHHGPTTINCPLVFIEVGSSESEWNNQDAIEVVGKTIIEMIDKINAELLENESYIGFGGGHYAPEFTKLVKLGVNIGHIIPKHYIDTINENIIDQMIEKTVPRPKKALVEWKSLNSELKEMFIPYLASKGIEIVKTEKLKKDLRQS